MAWGAKRASSRVRSAAEEAVEDSQAELNDITAELNTSDKPAVESSSYEGGSVEFLSLVLLESSRDLSHVARNHLESPIDVPSSALIHL